MQDWLFLFLGLILGIPFSIFANIATPYVESYIKNRSMSIKERRIELLIAQYREMKKLRGKSNQYLFRFLIWSLIFILGSWPSTSGESVGEFFTSYYTGVYSLIITIIYFILVLFAEVMALNNIIRMMNLDSFEEYKRKMTIKLIKLGGRAQDLDR